MKARWRSLELEEILPMVLGPYERQQRRVLTEFGGDEDEVRRRVERMKDWAELCHREKREVPRRMIANELFGPAEPPRFEPIPMQKCSTCEGSGMYLSENCQPSRKSGQVEGVVVCVCPAGKMRNKAIKDHGKRLESKGRRRAQAEDEW